MTEITDLLQQILWKIDGTLINMITFMLTSLIDGVLTFGENIFSKGNFINDAFNTAKALMFILLPCKLVYEVIFAISRDEVENIQVPKKILGAFMCVAITFATPTVFKAANNLAVGSIKTIVGNVSKTPEAQDVTSNPNSFPTQKQQDDWNKKDSKQIDNLITSSVLASFGGMDKHHAELATQAFKQNINAAYWEGKVKPSPKVCRDCNGKWEVDDKEKDEVKKGFIPEQQFEVGGDKKGYIWDHSLISVFGFIIFVVLLGYISIQVGMRCIQLIFFYIITPLATSSLTNANNPQAFIIWKNSILSNWITNFAEIFMLGLFSALVSDISRLPINNEMIKVYTQVLLFFASLIATIGIGAYIQSMLGGYGAGIMDGLRSVGAMTRAVTGSMRLAGGAVSFAGGMTSIAGKGMELAGDKLSNSSSNDSSSNDDSTSEKGNIDTSLADKNNNLKQANANENKENPNGFDSNAIKNREGINSNNSITSGNEQGLDGFNNSNVGGNGENPFTNTQNSRQSSASTNNSGIKQKLGAGISGVGRGVRKVGNVANAAGNFVRGKGYNRSNLPLNADSINYNSPFNQADFGRKSRFKGDDN